MRSLRSTKANWAAIGGFFLLGLWWLAVWLAPTAWALPGPWAIMLVAWEGLRSGQTLLALANSLTLWLLAMGLAFSLAIPLGFGCAHQGPLAAALLPWLALAKAVGPLLWLPFALLCFGMGARSVFLVVFMAAFFPLVLSSAWALATLPRPLLHLADEWALLGWARWRHVLLPACAPALLRALRHTANLAWASLMVAEMVASQKGLGFLMWQAHQGKDMARLLWGMLLVALVAWAMDRSLHSLAMHPRLRWAHAN